MHLSEHDRFSALEDHEPYADSATNTRYDSDSPWHQPAKRRRIATYLLVALVSAATTLITTSVFAAAPIAPILPSSTQDSFVPDFPFTTIIEFQEDSRYTVAGWESAYDRLGLNTYPNNGGFIAVPNPATYGLRGGPRLLPLNGTIPQEKYCISVFHQIHCLKMLRVGMAQLIAGKPRQHGAWGGGFTRHEDHCFEYIRQALVCAADTTLEEPRKSGVDTDGWGTEHVCRNWDEVVEFAQEHGYTKWFDWGTSAG